METSWQINTLSKDGIIETRKGYALRVRLPDGKAGGLTSFKDSNGNLCLLAIVDDIPYISREPFDKYEKLEI